MQQNRQGGWMQITHWIRQLNGFSLFSLKFANCAKQEIKANLTSQIGFIRRPFLWLICTSICAFVKVCRFSSNFNAEFNNSFTSFKFNIQHYIQTEYLNKLKMF